MHTVYIVCLSFCFQSVSLYFTHITDSETLLVLTFLHCLTTYAFSLEFSMHACSVKLEVVKQEMARVKVNILGISELKSTGMGEFNSDDHYIYYCGQESFPIIIIKAQLNTHFKYSFFVLFIYMTSEITLIQDDLS